MSADLESRLRAANPASVRRGDPVSERGLEMLAEITGAAPERPAEAEPAVAPVVEIKPRRRRTFAPLLGAAAAAVVMVAVVVNLNGVGGAGDSALDAGGGAPESSQYSMASAWVEPLAIDAAVDESASDLLASAARQAATGTGLGSGDEVLSISTWDRASDSYGGEVYMREGEDEAYAQDGDAEDSGGDGAEELDGQDAEGSAESDDDLKLDGDFAAEESIFVEVPAEASDLPTDVDAVGPYLSGFLGLESTDLPGYLVATRALLLQYTLTSEQESTLLEFYAGQDGLEVLGRALDRAGREAYVLSVVDGSDLEYLMLISPETGAILSMETVYIGVATEMLESPSVLEYTLWER